MKANSSPMSVADYCHDFNNKKIIVNKMYQRNVGLWTSQAQSFFIESILLENPIPKIFLYARLDLKSRQQIKEIVDGQQRTQALVVFFNDEHRLTKNIDTEELRGLTYNQLTEDWQTRFLGYSLPIDQFSGVSEDEVRDAFRRMNANNIPLNAEEQRNALFQGPFKWFIVQIADLYKGPLSAVGLFSRRDLMRMSDLKLYADIIHTIDNGFATIKAKQINDLYKKYNGVFDKEEEYKATIRNAIELFLHKSDLHRHVFLRAHVFQTIVLAIIEMQRPGTIPNLPEAISLIRINREIANRVPLDILANALSEPESYAQLEEFIDACTSKTNVQSQRLIRFSYFLNAISS